MARRKLTKSVVDGMPITGKQHFLWCATPPGFGVRCSPNGAKAFIYQFRVDGVSRRTVVAKLGELTVEQARARAEKLAGQKSDGVDPVAEKRKIAKAEAERQAEDVKLAFDEYVEDYLDRIAATVKPRTVGFYRDCLRVHCTPALGATPLPAITRKDVVRVLDGIPAKQQSARISTFSTLRALFRHALDRGEVASSPLAGMKAPPPVADRERLLNDQELALCLRAAAALPEALRSFYELLAATGARRDEIAALEWSEVRRGDESWTLPASRSKNGEAQRRPLNAIAVSTLDRVAGGVEWPTAGRVIFGRGGAALGGFSKAKKKLDEAMAKLAREEAEKAGGDPTKVTLEPFVVHDLRKAMASTMQRLGVPGEAIERLLGHTRGGLRGIARVYRLHDYASEMREASEKWANHIRGLLNQQAEQGVVLPMRPGKAA